MKKFLLIPLFLSAASFPLAGGEEEAQVGSIPAEPIASSKQKMIDEVLFDYQSGYYNSFLKKIDEEYRDAEKNRSHNALLEQRKKLSATAHDYGVDKTDTLKKKIASLRQSQDQELVEIALNYPTEKISREVRDMIFFFPSEEEKESIEFIQSLSLKFKGDGATPIENKLIQIDTEFWLKNLSLEIISAQNKMGNEAFQKKHLVLQLEKIKQMSEACRGEWVDSRVKSLVDTAASALPKVYASATTRKYLLALGRGKIAPQTPLEKDLQKVMVKYLEKEEALY